MHIDLCTKVKVQDECMACLRVSLSISLSVALFCVVLFIPGRYESCTAGPVTTSTCN